MIFQLVAIGGPVGVGKSSVARLLAQQVNERRVDSDAEVRVLRSDVFRKQFLGIDLTAPLPRSYHESGLYSRAIYRALHDVAATVVSVGDTAFIDATYTRRWQREGVRSLGVRWAGFWLSASAKARVERLRSRQGDASDAGPDFVLAQLIEPPAAEEGWTLVDAEASSVWEVASTLLRLLDPEADQRA